MNHSVAALYVGFDNVGSVDSYFSVGSLDGGLTSLNGGDLARLDVSGHHLPRDNMVFEDSCQLLLVLRLKERLHGSGRKFFEGFIGGGEDGEGTIAGESFNESGCLGCGDEGREVFIAGGDADDGWSRFRAFLCLDSERCEEREGGGDACNQFHFFFC